MGSIRDWIDEEDDREEEARLKRLRSQTYSINFDEVLALFNCLDKYKIETSVFNHSKVSEEMEKLYELYWKFKKIKESKA